MGNNAAHGGEGGRQPVARRKAGLRPIDQGSAKGRRSPPHNAASSRAAFAAVDLGTNNCRLLIAEPLDQGFHVIDAFSRIVRLGEGLAAQGSLSEAAMARTISALRVCAGKMRRHSVEQPRPNFDRDGTNTLTDRTWRSVLLRSLRMA